MTKVIVINNQFFGSGNDDLGEKLMGSFLRKVWGQESKPEKIVFYNSGVKLLAEGSACLDVLDGLNEAGVDLIACGTCITFFNLKTKLRFGRVSDMTEIASLLADPDGTVTV